MIPSQAYVSELKEAAMAIVRSRELCGNEAQALRDWQTDYRKLAAHEVQIVKDHADRIWRGYQSEAGVTDPIGPEERAKINRVMR